MYYLIECRDSDGNACYHIDFIVEARHDEDALDKLMDNLIVRVPGAEEDGGYGAYYPCDCDIPEDEADFWECSHGGFTLDHLNIEAYETKDEAVKASSIYHCTEVI